MVAELSKCEPSWTMTALSSKLRIVGRAFRLKCSLASLSRSSPLRELGKAPALDWIQFIASSANIKERLVSNPVQGAPYSASAYPFRTRRCPLTKLSEGSTPNSSEHIACRWCASHQER